MDRRGALFGSNKNIISNAFLKDFVEGNAINSFYNDKITSVDVYKFFHSNIKNIYLPNVVSAQAYSFATGGTNDRGVERLFLPSLIETYDVYNPGATVFTRNKKLKVLEIGLRTISPYIFDNCTSLEHLILTSPTVVQIVNNRTLETTFSSTCFRKSVEGNISSGGYLYVPRDLIPQYIAAGWQDELYLKNEKDDETEEIRIRAIEDIPNHPEWQTALYG